MAGEAIKEIGRQSVLLSLIVLWVNIFDPNEKEAQSKHFDVATLAFFMCSSRSRKDIRNSYISGADICPYSKEVSKSARKARLIGGASS